MRYVAMCVGARSSATREQTSLAGLHAPASRVGYKNSQILEKAGQRPNAQAASPQRPDPRSKEHARADRRPGAPRSAASRIEVVQFGLWRRRARRRGRRRVRRCWARRGRRREQARRRAVDRTTVSWREAASQRRRAAARGRAPSRAGGTCSLAHALASDSRVVNGHSPQACWQMMLLKRGGLRSDLHT